MRSIALLGLLLALQVAGTQWYYATKFSGAKSASCARWKTRRGVGFANKC